MKRTASLKTELQSMGMGLCPQEGVQFRIRRGGAGPAEGMTVVIGDSPATVPVSSPFVADSPYRMTCRSGGWELLRGEEPVASPVALLPEPAFYRQTTSDGVACRQVALLHGNDCLATTVLQTCTYWGTRNGCAFCGIGLSLKNGQTILQKTPAQLAEVAVQAAREGGRHVTLTSGTTKDRALEVAAFEASTRAISEATGLPVHVQLMPPVTRGDLERLRDAGVVTLGLHLESFDYEVLGRVSPCKAALPMAAYMTAWREAVAVFGRNQVSSYLLMGLGERREILLDGCRRLAELGVYPFLVPFRPIPGTPLQDLMPLDPAHAKDCYQEVAGILRDQGIHWRAVRAGCVRCRACSALPDYQDALERPDRKPENRKALSWEVVQTGPFLEASLAIRREVFVEEQGIFAETDLDALDPVSYHIVVRRGDECLGSVRITPQGDGVWLGSRLAVRKGHRGRLGFWLVNRAEEEVLKRKGRRFVAYIQMPKVNFFQRCGWQNLREIPDYHGHPHMLMLAAGNLWGDFRETPTRPAFASLP